MKNENLSLLHEIDVLENLYLSGAIYTKEHENKLLALISEISKFNTLIFNNLEK